MQEITEECWMTYTSQVLDLDDGCWIAVEDDPNGGYAATVHVDDECYTVFEATRTEIEEFDDAKKWAFETHKQLCALVTKEQKEKGGPE